MKKIYILLIFVGLATLLIGVKNESILCPIGALLEVTGATLLLLKIRKETK